MSLVVCSLPRCKTSAGCKCNVVAPNKSSDATIPWERQQELYIITYEQIIQEQLNRPGLNGRLRRVTYT